MAKAKHVSETPATLWLRKNKIAFSELNYDYLDHGGAMEAARQLELEPHQVAKTLIMEDENAKPLIIIMQGDKEVSTKNLARQIGVKKLALVSPKLPNGILRIKLAGPRHSERVKRCLFI